MSISIATKGGNKFQKHIVTQTANWCLGQLMPRIKKIYIDIHLRNIKDADGYCSCDSIDDDDFVGRSPRSYTLEIDKSLSLTEMVSTTIHEMVHVKQYVFCELRDVSAKANGWKSQLVSCDVKYEDQPWEKEAYRLQEKLLVRCLTEAVFQTDVDKNGFAHTRV